MEKWRYFVMSLHVLIAVIYHTIIGPFWLKTLLKITHVKCVKECWTSWVFFQFSELDHHQPKVVVQLLGEAGLPDVLFLKKGDRLLNSLQACAVEHLHQQVSSRSCLFCSFDDLLDGYPSLIRVLYFHKCHQQTTMWNYEKYFSLSLFTYKAADLLI